MSLHYAEAMAEFAALLAQAQASTDPEPTAMTLATASANGRVSARTVLLKSHDARGLVFFTNSLSQKGRELAAHPQAALLFHWRLIGHGVQARFEGLVQPIAEDESDAYFSSRPRMSQIGAWASDQSATLDSREQFGQRMAEVEARFAGKPVERPPHWFGYCLAPDCIELWYGAEFRLHERYRFAREPDGHWSKRMLFP